MDTFLGSLVQSCCGEGGTLQTNSTGVCSRCLSHTGPAPAHGVCAFPVYTAQALSCSPRNRLRPALGCMHLPGLSRSGSGTWVVLRGIDSVGPAFCALPRSEQLRQSGVWQAHCPTWAVSLNHLPSLSHLVSQVHRRSTVSGVPCVSSGELISGCDPLGRCQPSRIPGRHG